jgi:hypothetical protein
MMAADRQTVAMGCAIAGLILGSLTADLMSLAAGRPVTVNLSILPWWLDAAMAAGAIVIAVQVTHRLVRIASITFAAARLGSIAAVAQALSIPGAALFTLHALFATTVMAAAWPKAGRLARSMSLLLFVVAAAIRFWSARPTSVVGS